MRLSNEIGAASEDLRRLSAIVVSLQRQAQTQGPESVVRVGYARAKSVEAPILALTLLGARRTPWPLAETGFNF